ncbi:MAG: RelA/SpoT family protein [Acidiferrobacteraceae bacterium]
MTRTTSPHPNSPSPLPKTKPPLPPAAAGRVSFHISDLCRLLESYLPEAEVAAVYRAYLFGAEAHEGQRRRSGEPYIYHPIEVAHLLADLHLDHQTIIAALLHDVIEDTSTAKEQLVSSFGREVAELVDGVSKIGQIEFESKEEEQAENFRKMLMAMAKDLRVILIKLADRVHNMRTLTPLSFSRQRAIARETLDIYAPIANRLGLHAWSLDLEDLSFACLFPMRNRVLSDAVRKRHGNRKAVVEKIRTAILDQLRREGVVAEVTGREKNIYGIYKKMRQKKLPFERVYDLHAFRIIVDRADNCYRTLGVVHSIYKPIPGRFKDYIAIPKANGYQSLHTVVFGPYGLSVEVQIRTEEMHRVAEAGVAAHWLYKTGDAGAQKRALQWLHGLMEIQQQAGNPREFLEHLKVDLFPDEVYVFTPNGDIKKLPRGATVVDFAYEVHTDVGHHCSGARVNHQAVPLRTPLHNGDHVEILTSTWSTPHPSWLNYVVTGKARAHIRSFLKNLRRDEAVRLGERLLGRALKAFGGSFSELTGAQQRTLLDAFKLKDWDDLLADIGLGNRLAPMVARQLLPALPASGVRSDSLAILGTEGIVVSYARCCWPIPGDPVLGFLSSGRGIVVHLEDCPNVAESRKHTEKWIDVQWSPRIEGVFPVALRIEVRNQRGVLAMVAAAIAQMDANIDTVSIEERDGQNSVMDFVVEVRDRLHLAHIMRRVRSQDQVVRLSRRRG